MLVDSNILGKEKELEVASTLIRNGIYVFQPLVDAGVDLVATNKQTTKFIPIQAKYRAKDPALNLFKKDIERFVHTKPVLAFIIGVEPNLKTWYIPFDDWLSKSIDKNRNDNRIYVRIKENENWLQQFESDSGLRTTFKDLL